MRPTVGGLIWIRCDVKPGPFSDERLVRVQSDVGEWLGFVPVEALQEPVVEGQTFVRGTITEIQDDRFEVMLPGHAVTQNTFAGEISRIQPVGSFEAGHSPLYQ